MDVTLYSESQDALELITSVLIPAFVALVSLTVLALWMVWAEPPMSGEWAAGVTYVVNDEVVYQGMTYRCLQAHTANPEWEPPNVPMWWALG